MQAAACIAERMGMLGAQDARRQTDLLRVLGLPLQWKAAPEDILGHLSVDKKRAGARQRWVLAERVGAGRVRDDVPAECVYEAVSSITST
jgi:3-dehydroquinate synthetase